MPLVRPILVFFRWLDDLNRRFAAVRYAAWYSCIWMPCLVVLFDRLLSPPDPVQKSPIVGVLFGASFIGGLVLYFVSWIRMSLRLHQEDPKVAEEWERDHPTLF